MIWANNEVGTVQPVAEVGRGRPPSAARWSHSDAVQAVGHLPVDFAASGLDLLTLHRPQARRPVRGRGAAGPPRGRADPGAARRRSGARRALRHPRRGRGGRFRGRGARSAVRQPRARSAARLAALRDRAGRRPCRAATRTPCVHGPDRPGRAAARGGERRLPGLLGRRAAAAARRGRHRLLDRLGLLGRGVPAEPRAAGHGAYARPRPRSALRFSLGHSSTAADIDRLAAALPEAVQRARAAGALRLSARRSAEPAYARDRLSVEQNG